MSTLAELLGAIRGTATVEQAEDVVALLLLRNPVNLQADGRALLARYSARAGLDPSLTSEQLEAAVARYLEGHPLNPTVVAAFKAVAQRLVEENAPHAADVAVALSMVGGETSKTPLGGGVRPAGTVPAGPAARFKMDPKKK